MVDAGITLVSVNYDLAPAVSVSDITAQSIKAFDWVYHNIAQWQGNPNQIVVGGHSVGAFLAAKIVQHNWQQDVRQSIKGAVLLSGLYDLAQMKQSYLNAFLKLTDEDVLSLSPIHDDVSQFPKTIIAVGDNETDEFIRQSFAFSEKLHDLDKPHQYTLLKNKNHYTVSRLLSRKNNDLMNNIISMCQTG